MQDRDVAIIIVSYKSAQLTVDCLASIARERQAAGLRIRCVVVDNASGDDRIVGPAIAANGWQDWARLVVAPRNGGFAYGNNVGLAEVLKDGRPEFVHLLNPDTVLHAGAIEALVAFFDRTPRAGIAGGIFENEDGSEWAIAFRFPTWVSELEQGLGLGAVTRVLSRWKVPLEMGRNEAPVDWVSGASMMVRLDVFQRIGGLDETFFLYFEETEFCFRAKAAGWEVWYVPESRVTHIAGQSTKVTERNVGPRRLPAYWFDSRRLFFTLTRGPAYALLADVVALAAGALGLFKSFVQRRMAMNVPNFLRDLARHSLVFRPAATAASVRVRPPRFD